MNSKSIVALMALGCCFPIDAFAQHVHGVIRLGVVVDGNTVAVSLDAPMSDVIGFEHAPRDEDQAAKVRDAASRLADADAMFGLPPSADCKVSKSNVTGPEFFTKLMDEKGNGEHQHGDNHDAHDAEHSHEGESDHADHADHHDDHHDHDDHDHDEKVHSEINANYEWSCGDMSEVSVLVLRFTQGFANVETIELQVLTAMGATVDKLEGRVNSVPLSTQ